MNTSFHPFNLILFFLAILAVLANAWVWRHSLIGFFRNVETTPMVETTMPVVSSPEFVSGPENGDGDASTTSSVTEIQPENGNKPSDSPNDSTEPPQPTEPPQSSAALPASINLPVPFTSQAPEKNWEQPWQDACEEATVLMMDAYYKKYGLSPLFAKDELLKMVAWEEEWGWGLSIEMEKLKKLLDEYGDFGSDPWRMRVIENPTVDEMKQLVATGHPILVVADGKVLDNPHFRNGGPEYHTLIIRGYTPTHFIANDPGTQFGENYLYTYDNLMESIRDWNNGNVKQGRRVILVIDKLST